MKQIYSDQYWTPWADITDNRVAAKCFDTGVNIGIGTEAEYLQQSLCALGHALMVDGHIGPMTLAAVNGEDPDKILDLLCLYQRNHYIHWIAQNSNREQFRRGLLARAADLP